MNKILALLVILSAASCALITEPNISNSQVVLIGPVDGLKTAISTHTFWWEYVPDAQRYNIQIVSPRWDSVITLVADSNLNGNKFVATLPPGNYEWAVRAYNASSSTKFFIRKLIIDTTSSLGFKQVILIHPREKFDTNGKRILFKWHKVELADQYLFDIKRESWQGNNVIPTHTTQKDTFGLNLEEGKYVWGVQAKNDFSNTLYKTSELIIDITPPAKPNFVAPAKQADTLFLDSDNTVSISWQRPETSLSAMKDSILIATDSSKFYANIKTFKITTDTQIKIEGLTKRVYWLKIRSFDTAGNVGQSTSIRRFYVDEK